MKWLKPPDHIKGPSHHGHASSGYSEHNGARQQFQITGLMETPVTGIPASPLRSEVGNRLFSSICA